MQCKRQKMVKRFVVYFAYWFGISIEKSRPIEFYCTSNAAVKVIVVSSN